MVESRWYVGVYCSNCQSPIFIAEDLSGGTVKKAERGRMSATCPECGRTDQYENLSFTSFKVDSEQK